MLNILISIAKVLMLLVLILGLMLLIASEVYALVCLIRKVRKGE